MHTRYMYSVTKGVKKIRTKTALLISAISLAISGAGGLSLALMGSAHAASSTWSLNGNYTIDFEYQGGHYVHDATITGQNSTGDFSVSGGYPAGASPYQFAWNGSGNVSNNDVTLAVDYNLGAVGTHMDMSGTVAANGTISGNWSDNYGGSRSGTWTTQLSSAKQVSQVVVTPPVNSQNWSIHDTTSGGVVNFVKDSSAPGTPNTGALQLTTDATVSSKAQYMHAANIPLSNVSELSYSTKQNTPAGAIADASYQLPVFLTGTSGFSTLVFEPYQNPLEGAVSNGVWQSWDVANGLFWSTRTVVCANGTITGSAGGPAVYTLAQVKATCPSANVLGFGVDIGSNNPSYNVEADLVDFNGTTYNFEPYVVVTDKDACKNDGWKTAVDSNGNGFKNQGACVSFVASNGKSLH